MEACRDDLSRDREGAGPHEAWREKDEKMKDIDGDIAWRRRSLTVAARMVSALHPSYLSSGSCNSYKQTGITRRRVIPAKAEIQKTSKILNLRP